MTELFLKVVNMNISASWLILAVLLLRLVLRRSPKWVNMLLWGIVAVRLVCPFSFESAASLIPSSQTIQPEIMMDWSPEIDTGFTVLNETVNPVIADTFAPKPAMSANPLQIWIPVWSVIWLAGMSMLLTYGVASYWLLRRRVAAAVRLRYDVFQSERINTPFVLGILKPRIYLPFAMAAENMIHVISHEKAHIRRRDHWWKPLGFFILTVHWMNPLMWLAYKLFCRDMELACDEKVIRNMNNHQRADYAQALLSCSVKRRRLAACPIAFGEVGVKTRIRSVMNYRKPSFWVMLVALAACIAIAVCFLTDPKSETVPLTVPAAAEPEIEAPAGGEAETPQAVQPEDPRINALRDISYFLEYSVVGKTFQDMDRDRLTDILAEYSAHGKQTDLLEDFVLWPRESTDGTVSYIAGYFDGDIQDNPFYGMYQYGSAEVELALVTEQTQQTPEKWYVLENSDIRYSPESGFILIQPKYSGVLLWDVFGMYLHPNGREYILDAMSRGISLIRPVEPYLEVYMISEQWGEITEWIPLTQEQLDQILAQPRQKLPDGFGFAASVYPSATSSFYIDEEMGWFTEKTGIPQLVLDLAKIHCGYSFHTPAEIITPITEARLDCGWLEEPVYADASGLPLLQSILQNAEYGYVGGCGYGARLTIRMEDGSEMVIFKGSDGCDTMVFGSYSGYFIGDEENRQFWDIFGIDIEAAWG